MSAYEPGTVAVATVRGVPNMRVMRRNDPEIVWLSVEHPGGTCHHTEEQVTDVRPLVVIDHDAKQLARCLRIAASAIDDGRSGYELEAMVLRSASDQIEAQTRPPKPAEPGRYGVVIAGDGREWFRWTTSERSGRDWCRPGTDGGTKYATWDDLDVLSVRREGDQP